MNRVSGEALRAIERDIVGQMVRAFEVDLEQVLFDATNFFTFIVSFRQGCRGRLMGAQSALVSASAPERASASV